MLTSRDIEDCFYSKQSVKTDFCDLPISVTPSFFYMSEPEREFYLKLKAEYLTEILNDFLGDN